MDDEVRYLSVARPTRNLISAVERGKIEEVRQALQEPGLDINDKGSEGTAALHVAASKNDAPILKLLLEQPKANVNVRDADGWTPLHYAAHKSHKEAIHILIKAGANKIALTEEGFTPWEMPAHYKHESGDPHGEIPELMMLSQEEANRLLIQGVKKERVEHVGYAIMMHADPNTRDPSPKRNNATPLHIAADHNEPHIMEMLLAHGADPNARDGDFNTPMHYAAEHGKEKNVEVLLQHGGDPTLLNSEVHNVFDIVSNAKPWQAEVRKVLGSPADYERRIKLGGKDHAR